MDAISALRDCALDSGRKVQLLTADGDEVKDIGLATVCVLGSPDRRYPLDTITSYASVKRTSSSSIDSESFFKLNALLLAYLTRDLSHTDYFQECRRMDIKHLTLVIRRDFLDYLSSHKNESDYIRSDAPLSAIGSAGEAGKPVDAGGSKKVVKRVRMDEDSMSAEKLVKEILENERVLKDRNSAVIAKTAKSFELNRKAAMDIVNNRLRKGVSGHSSSSSHHPHSHHRATSTAGIPVNQHSKPAGDPIILVPATLTSLVTLFNVQSLLEKAKFRPVEQVRSQDPRKPTDVRLTKVSGRSGKKMTYRVVESIQRLEDWDRVVAVICGGQDWQFRGWKWEEPVELFSNVKGFYFKYSDKLVEGSVKSWNVTVLDFNRNKRHLDAQSVHQFWNELEQWISIRKPELMYEK